MSSFADFSSALQVKHEIDSEICGDLKFMSLSIESLGRTPSEFKRVWLSGLRVGEPVLGSATIFHLEGDEFGQMYEVMEISICSSGIEGFSKYPVIPGSMVSMGFESPQHHARCGEVIGCVRCDEGWKIGIEFDNQFVA